MPKFTIEIVEFRYATYEVEAPDEETARGDVWVQVRDDDFKTDGFEINQVSKVEED